MGTISNLVTNDIAAVADEVVCGRARLLIGGAIANHNDVGVVVERTAHHGNGLGFATSTRCRLIHIETGIFAIECKEDFVRVHVFERNAQLQANGLDQTVESSGDQVDLFAAVTQACDEFSANTHTHRDTQMCVIIGDRQIWWWWFVTGKWHTHLIPGDNVLGCAFRKSRICCCVGRMMFKRNRRASWNVIEPPIAALVRRATSSPLLQNRASSSMPSSRITVESTSKHTTFEALMIWAASWAFFDLSAWNNGIVWFIVTCSILKGWESMLENRQLFAYRWHRHSSLSYANLCRLCGCSWRQSVRRLLDRPLMMLQWQRDWAVNCNRRE